MNKPPDKNNKKTPIAKSLKSGAKSLSKEVIINYLANGFDALVKIVIKYFPAISVVAVSAIASLYYAVIRFTGKTFVITGRQIISVVALVFFFLLLVFASAKIRGRYLDKSGKHKKVFGLSWRVLGEGLIGPYCPHCSKAIISEESHVESVDQMIGDMFGEAVEYIYSCPRCTKEIKLNQPLEKFRAEAYKVVLEK